VAAKRSDEGLTVWFKPLINRLRRQLLPQGEAGSTTLSQRAWRGFWLESHALFPNFHAYCDLNLQFVQSSQQDLFDDPVCYVYLPEGCTDGKAILIECERSNEILIVPWFFILSHVFMINQLPLNRNMP